MARPEIGIYLPHMGLPYEDVERRVRRCENSGIDSLWLYDHLFAPGMPDHPSLEAWTLATALLARTDLDFINDPDSDPIPGCMSGVDDPQCPDLYAPLGIPFREDSPAEDPQAVFKALVGAQ